MKQNVKRKNNRTLHYKIKFQDKNVAIIKFYKNEIAEIFKETVIYIEIADNDDIDNENLDDSLLSCLFWESFEDSLLEINGIIFAMLDGYEIIIIKDPSLPNWQDIIKDVIWTTLLFINADNAVQISKKDGKIISESLVCSPFV